jgi:hypothetical protein
MTHAFRQCHDPREVRARQELYLAQRSLESAKGLLHLQCQQQPEGDHQRLVDRVTKAQQRVESIAVVVAAYDKEQAT